MRGLREPRGRVGTSTFTEDALESQGLVILGSPIAGTCRFVEAMLDKTLYQTREYIKKAQDVLLPNAATSNHANQRTQTTQTKPTVRSVQSEHRKRPHSTHRPVPAPQHTPTSPRSPARIVHVPLTRPPLIPSPILPTSPAPLAPVPTVTPPSSQKTVSQRVRVHGLGIMNPVAALSEYTEVAP